MSARMPAALVLAFFALLSVAAFAHAAGVSQPYWDENPLRVYPGESKDIQFILQNGVGNQDMTFTYKLSSSAEIIRPLDSQASYKVPAGNTNTPVNFRVSIPANATIGTEYSVGIEFTSKPETQAGLLQLGSAYTTGFKVIVGEKPLPPPGAAPAKPASTIVPTLLLILGVAVLALILWLVLRRRKRERMFK